jgi:hypothetical protein
MGSWRITVEGVGCHHNKDPKIDADLATKEFVAKLKVQGHSLKKASFELTNYQGEAVTGENLLVEEESKS